MYPPRAVSFSVGHRPDDLQPVSQVYPCEPSHEWQVFRLPAGTPAAGFLKVRLG